MAHVKKLALYQSCNKDSKRKQKQIAENNNDKLKPAQEENTNSEQDVNVSNNLVEYLKCRELGNQRLQCLCLNLEFGTRHLLQKNLLVETEVPLQFLNKVFCSQWLSGHQVIFGTKCNKLVVYDVRTSRFVLIPSLEGSPHSVAPEIPCGIHSIQLNPSRTLLATGAQNPNDVAIYRLPSMDPVCVGEGAHKDWIFDIVWLDDQFFVSGSRDTTVALWRINDNLPQTGLLTSHKIIRPLIVRRCKLAQKVRALVFNNRRQELIALSLNAYLHLYDIESFRQKMSCRLPHSDENVCLAMQHDYSLYAVGSKSHISLIDTRTLHPIKTIPSSYESCSVRSTCFTGNILSVGTGIGLVMFYDIRAGKFLHLARKSSNKQNTQATLKTTKGWVYRDDFFRDVFQSSEYSPAIYTHCYDPSGTKLFAAGGPLPASLYGNYAGLWQ